MIGSQDHVLQSFSLKLMLSKPGSTSDEIFWSSPSLGEDPRENDGGLFAVFILFVPCIQKKIQDQDVEILAIITYYVPGGSAKHRSEKSSR